MPRKGIDVSLLDGGGRHVKLRLDSNPAIVVNAERDDVDAPIRNTRIVAPIRPAVDLVELLRQGRGGA